MVPEIFASVSLQGPFIAADKLRTQVAVLPRVLALVLVKWENFRCLQHVVRLFQIVQVREMELLGLLRGRVRVVPLRVVLRGLVIVHLYEERDRHALELSSLALLVNAILLQIQHVAHK